MEYLPIYIYHTFHLGQMLVPIPYMEHIGLGASRKAVAKPTEGAVGTQRTSQMQLDGGRW